MSDDFATCCMCTHTYIYHASCSQVNVVRKLSLHYLVVFIAYVMNCLLCFCVFFHFFQVFILKFIEIGKVLLTNAVLENNSVRQAGGCVSLHGGGGPLPIRVIMIVFCATMIAVLFAYSFHSKLSF